MKKAVITVMFMLLIVITSCSKKEEDNSSSKKDILWAGQFKEVTAKDITAEIVIKDYGSIKVKLFKDNAPKAVENFIQHSKDGYYDGSSINRIIKDFMIQTGKPVLEDTVEESIWGGYFEDELDNGLYPFQGALCMANTGINTNASQFFIVVTSSEKLDEIKYLIENGKKISFKSYIEQAYGRSLSDELLGLYMEYGGAPWLTGYHTVFGQVYEGIEIAEEISNMSVIEDTSTPKEEIIVEKIIITEAEKQ